MSDARVSDILITESPWGGHQEKAIMLFRLKNTNGAFIEVTNYGATLVSVVVPDKNGKMENVILRYPSLEGYVRDDDYIGSTIGRFANRIDKAQFSLDGTICRLEKNDGQHTNHGGLAGFNSRVFDYTTGNGTVAFSVFSNDGEGGYPGNLQFTVTYGWSDDNALSISYSAVSDRRTVMNFTNHAYFNLSAGRTNIFSHELTIHAAQILETGPGYIPTGTILPANERSFYKNNIRDRMSAVNKNITGLNTYYVFEQARNISDAVCELKEWESGRTMDVYTTYPGVQLYTGDFLGSEFHRPFDGLCLECQYYPDSPNHVHFPSAVFDAGQVFTQQAVYKFGVAL